MLVLLTVMALLLGALMLFDEKGDDWQEQQVVAADSVNTVDTTRSQSPVGLGQLPAPRKVERFSFDPNTADSTALLRLGLRPFQVRNIYKYRAAGGIYRAKEDFAQLYGLTLKEYRELEPYINITADYQPAANVVKRAPRQADTLRYAEKLSQGETVNVALADTAELRRVPGIGSYYARRIVRYREQLGGFVSVEQLDEIDGFPAEAKQYLVLADGQTVRPLNLNKLSLNELRSHPYLNYYQARAIVEFRRTNGKLASLDDLQLMREFTSQDRQRLAPYVAF